MTERAVPFYCPYCGDEDLEPYESHGGWHCRACARAFSLRFIGTGALVSGRAAPRSAGSEATGATRKGDASKRPLTARAELARSKRARSGEGAR